MSEKKTKTEKNTILLEVEVDVKIDKKTRNPFRTNWKKLIADKIKNIENALPPGYKIKNSSWK